MDLIGDVAQPDPRMTRNLPVDAKDILQRHVPAGADGNQEV